MGAAPVEEEEEDGPLEDWTRKELADECKKLGLSDKGTKAVLIGRIQESRAAATAVPSEEPMEIPEAMAEATEEPVVEEVTPAVEEEPPAVEETAPVEEVTPVEEAAPAEEAEEEDGPLEE